MRAMDELRPLSAGRLLELWRACREIEDPLERILQCNGQILAECCRFQGEAVYAGGGEALNDLTGREMEQLLGRLAEGRPPQDGGPEENPVFDLARFAALRGA